MANGSRLVFVGPSYPPPYPSMADLAFRPPAGRGDITRAVEAGARVIGLIDGVFHQSLAVTPAEIRAAARSGALLIGGASLGALRACECPQAMRGVGYIWSAFSRGKLTDDDEVAVTFMPNGYQTVAYPLVQLREAARLAAERYPIATPYLKSLVETLRARPFQERTLTAVRLSAADVERAGVPWVELEKWMTQPQFDVKRKDALQVMEAVLRADC